VLNAIRQREELESTALSCGVAFPHPRRPLPGALVESLLAYGRTVAGIPFGGGGGCLTDVFFLVLCRDARTHLQVLARLSRLLRRPDFLDELRATGTAAETLQVIDRHERELIA
jgi:PTS system nitrogen regulatory IIA component